jgi:hypothetical protein
VVRRKYLIAKDADDFFSTEDAKKYEVLGLGEMLGESWFDCRY